MTNFSINYSHPWLLLLLIPAVLLTLIPYFRMEKKYRATRNRILSMVFHLVAMVLAINLLAGISFSYELPNLENEVMILVDRTDSGEEENDGKDEFVQSVISICDNDYRLGIMKFGFDQKYVFEISADSSEAYEKYLESDDPDTSATDIASALKAASECFKNPKSAKIVLISDGVETDSAALSVIKSLAADGIKVDTVHFPNKEHNEIQIVDVKTPNENVVLGESFVTEVTLKSNIKNVKHSVKLSVYDNDELIGEAIVNIDKEEEVLPIAFSFENRGMHELAFTITSENDTIEKNNSYRTYMNLEVFENILIIEGYEKVANESKKLADLLSKTYKVTCLDLYENAEAIPTTLKELAEYEQVILMNVAYSEMPGGFEKLLNEYVYDLGGGLLTVGGDNDVVNGEYVTHAYNRNDVANSKYFKQMLPVNVVDYTPPIAVMIVIDASASMSMGKFPAAIQGAKACLDSLADRDFCGVMSFQTRASEELAVIPVAQRETILECIDNLEDNSSAQGGTIFSDAIMRAGRALSVINNVERKHIIMVTDGNPGDSYDTYLPYIKDNVKDGITMSVITIGEDMDSGLKEQMNNTATEAGGKFYNIPSGDYHKIPEYMQRDLALEAIAEIAYGEEFQPTVFDKTSVVAGIDPKLIPVLSGYYGTVPKADAKVALMGEYVPIYAQWQYGKGNVGSFLSDLSGIWSDTFMNDLVGQAIINNIINSVFPMTDVKVDEIDYQIKTDNYTTQLSVYGIGEGEKVVVDVTPLSESLANTLEGISVKEVEANRRYTFVIKDAGLYSIKIKKLDENGNTLSESMMYKTFSYSEEYNYFPERAPIGAELLEIVAQDGNGLVVTDAATVFESFSKTNKKVFDPRIIMLILAIVFVLLDIVVRKFNWKWPHELMAEHKEKKAEAEAQKG